MTLEGIPLEAWNGFYATIVTIVLAWLQTRTTVAVKDAAKETKSAVTNASTTAVEIADKAATVAETANIIAIAAADKQAVVAEATHSLVNSAMGEQLKMNAVIARRLADITGEAADREAADEAERAYQAHKKNQERTEQGVIDATAETVAKHLLAKSQVDAADKQLTAADKQLTAADRQLEIKLK